MSEVTHPPIPSCHGLVVGVIARDSDGNYLMSRRLRGESGIAPCAGHVELLECNHYQKKFFKHLRTTAQRELFEEYGISMADLRTRWQGVLPSRCRRGAQFHYWTVFEGVIARPDQAKANEDENTEARWYSQDEVLSLASRTMLFLSGKVDFASWENDPGLEVAWLDLFFQCSLFNVRQVALMIHQKEDQA